MTIDLQALTKIYIHRTLPTADDYSFKLISKYSSKDITEDFEVVYLSQTEGNGWAEVQFGVIGLDANKDYNGYYTLKVGYISPPPGSDFILLEENLVKVKYNVTADKVFTSDNEDNEQIIFYR